MSHIHQSIVHLFKPETIQALVAKGWKITNDNKGRLVIKKQLIPTHVFLKSPKTSC